METESSSETRRSLTLRTAGAKLSGMSWVLAALLALSGWPPARAAPRPRHRKRAPAAARAAEPGILARGRWLDANREALERLIRRAGKDSPDYSPHDPPIAVFALESSLAGGSPGETVFRRLVRRAEFRFGRQFWALLPKHHGAERIRSGYNGFRGAPGSVWEDEPHYRLYRKAFLKAHEDLCRVSGPGVCARWRASLLAGFTEVEMRLYARESVAEALQGPWREEVFGDSAEDPEPVRLRTGLRRIPETEDLARALLAAGFDVWVMTTSDQWSAEAFVQALGIHPSRVLGVRAKVAGGRLAPEVLEQTPYKAGQIELLASFIGRQPALVVGGEADQEMLSYSRGLRLALVDPARADAERRRRGDWLIQPAFDAR